jgi:ribulose-phosphate 3-epimerase
MHEVIPGILETDFQEIERKLQIIKPFSRRVHIDILDGKFSDTVSFQDPAPFSKYKDDFFLEAHFMVEDPTSLINSFANAGFKRFLGHIEKMKDVEEFIAEGQIFGEVGLALDLQTPISAINVPFDDLDCILLMSVKAGKSGQEFVSEVLEKIKQLRQKTNLPIEIDGGINEETIIAAKAEGAERFVATSYIFNNLDKMAAYEKLLSLS